MYRFKGHKDHDRRARVESGDDVDGWDFGKFRKVAVTYAVQIDEPFEVDTLEGLHTGKAGDWLAVGAEGEMYPIDAAIFEQTYTRWKQGDPE